MSRHDRQEKPRASATKAAWCCWPFWRGCRARPRRWYLWAGDPQLAAMQWTLTVLIVVLAWLGFAFAVRERVVFPLQTLSNLLGALREGDFSVRGRSPRPDDALGEVMREVNTLGSTLREQRLGAMEATTLLRTVMREIDVAIFAFDEQQRLRLVNRAGERLLAAPPERLLGQTAAELDLDSCLDGPAADHLAGDLPRRRRPLGRAAHAHPRTRPAAGTGGDLGPDPGFERAGIAGVAAAGAGAGPRAEQFAGAHQIDCRKPGEPFWRASRCRTTGATICGADCT